jgi:hypothetical protein
MARLAGNHSSKSTDYFGRTDELSSRPLSSNDLFSTPAPAAESVTLEEALRRVDAGEIDPMTVFEQLPLGLVTEAATFARSISGTGFGSLSRDEQRRVLGLLSPRA